MAAIMATKLCFSIYPVQTVQHRTFNFAQMFYEWDAIAQSVQRRTQVPLFHKGCEGSKPGRFNYHAAHLGTG